jgi:hypothetical protein
MKALLLAAFCSAALGGFCTAGVPASAAKDGSLVQLRGERGCLLGPDLDTFFAPPTACRVVERLHAVGGLAVSPDGRHAYAASRQTLLVFTRDRSTGVLRPVPGRRGCVRRGRGAACGTARAFAGPSSIAFSRGGRYVFVAAEGSGSVVVFARNRSSGQLRQLPGPAGCVSDSHGGGCRNLRGLHSPRDLAVEPKGRHLYVAASGIAALDIRGSAGLFQADGKAGCVAQEGGDGCKSALTLTSPRALVVSRDGRHVYASTSGVENQGGVTLLRRARDGSLTEQEGPGGCVAGTDLPLYPELCRAGRALNHGDGIAMAPDGRAVYVIGSKSDAVAVLRRDQSSGALAQDLGADGCLNWSGRYGCRRARGLDDPVELAVSPDGRQLYVASERSNAIAVFRQRGSGLRQLPGRRGCVAVGGGGACARWRGIGGFARVLALPRDGRHLYAGTLHAEHGALTAFRRR